MLFFHRIWTDVLQRTGLSVTTAHINRVLLGLITSWTEDDLVRFAKM